MAPKKMAPGFYQRVYDMVRRIPSGSVATYGQIAHLLDNPNAARAVGYALAYLPGEAEVPWHRVVNQQGKVSPRGLGAMEGDLQRAMLESEGHVFDEKGALNVRQVRWEGPGVVASQGCRGCPDSPPAAARGGV